MTRRKTTRQTRPTRQTGQTDQPVDRADHEVILFGGKLIPVLGTVGGTPEQSRQTAENIERFLASRNPRRRA